jgi:carboxypeptidase C (cathepsin A)
MTRLSILRASLALLLGFGLTLTLSAQGRGRGAQNTAGQGGRGGGAPAAAGDFYDFEVGAPSTAPIPDAAPVESHQKITLGGQTLAYTARAGFLPLRAATSGQSQAHLFFTYYAKDGAADAATRPLMFVVGGGPGVSAAWQEFAGLGPKKIALGADGRAGLPPYHWADNPNTPLDAADLVFVNPVGTAYSRPDTPALGPEFWNTRGDSASLAEFVRTFLTTYDRWNSPRTLVGDDLGTGRVASLALYLTEHQIPVNGIALLSLAVSADSTAGDAQYLTLLPSETLAAWTHHKLAADLQDLPADQVRERARQFASREYLHALYKGDRLSAQERTAAVADLAHLTGLSTTFVSNNDLRIPWDRFSAEILRGEHGAMATSDDRVGGFDVRRGGGRGRGGRGAPPPPPFDAAENELASAALGAYTTYLKHDLGFSTPGVFYLLNGGAGVFTATASDDATLSDLLSRNRHVHVLVALNDFDAGVPFYAAEFTLAHVQMAPEAAHNLVTDHFESGRAVFADPKAAAKLHKDLTTLIAASTGQGER